MNKDLFLLLVFSQMAMDGVSTASIQFYKNIYESLLSHPYLSCLEMAELASMSQQGANQHAHALTRAGYLRRKHYRGWSINDNALQNPLLLKLMRLA